MARKIKGTEDGRKHDTEKRDKRMLSKKYRQHEDYRRYGAVRT